MNNAFIHPLSGDMGIGTIAPVAKLHVEGNIHTSGLITASNIRVLGDYVILDTITSNTEQMVITNDGTGPALKVTQTGANSIAEFYDDGNALAFKVANDGLIGIGTATPQAKLHVVGSALVSSNLTVSGGEVKTGAVVASKLFSDTTTGTVAIGGALTTGTVTLGATGSTGAVSMFPATGAQAITLGGATTGLITLGSTAASAVQLPTGKTKVGQTTLAQGGAVSVTFPATAGTLIVLENALTSGTTDAGFLKYNGTTAASGQLDGGATTPTGTTRLNYGGYIYSTAVNLEGTGDTSTAATHYFVETGSDGFIRPKTLASARTEIVTTASVNSAAATTVGTITSGVWNAGAVTSSGAVSAGTQVLAPSGGLVGAPGFSWTGNTGTGIYRPAADTVAIVTGGVERMRVSSSGNVGINTVSPSIVMHVHSPTSIGTTAASILELARISSIESGNTDFLRIYGNRHTAGSDWQGVSTRIQRLVDSTNHGYIEFGPNGANASLALGANNVEAMRIDNSGNVGIGTTNPQQKLHISGGNSTHLMLETTVNGAPRSCGITFRAANSTIANPTGIYLDEADGIGVYAYGTTPRIYLPYTGNVGIGTTNPLAKLHVNGNFYCPGSVVQCVTTLYTDMTTYSIATTPTEITVLNVTITPKRANSKIMLQWMINGESLKAVFSVYRNSTAIGFNTASGNVQLSGVTAGEELYGEAVSPQNLTVNWVDLPNTTNAVIYSVRVNSSYTYASYTLYLNYSRSIWGLSLCSTGVAWEICV